MTTALAKPTPVALAPARVASPIVTTAASAISVRGLVKHFAVRRSLRDSIRRFGAASDVQLALDDVSCEIGEGEFFGLLGPNGAGKTTFFKILATLLSPDGGSVTIRGVDVARDPAAVRRLVVPVIADERGLYWRLTAAENLRLFATLYGLSGAARAARIAEVLQLVELHEAGTKMVGSFSSGMRQRLLIARALLARPKVLLLDEPTRSLDPIAARDFRAFLRTQVVRGEGCTIVLATHSADEAFGVCDRVAILDKGRLLATGAADQIARGIVGERYTVWTRTIDDAQWEFLERRGAIRHPRIFPADDAGWARVELEAPQGLDGAADVLATLIAAGIVVARFERIQLPLADLMERLVTAQGDDA